MRSFWKRTFVAVCLIAITPDLKVFPLREYSIEKVTHKARRKRWKPGQVRGMASRHEAAYVPRWDVHRFFRDWAGEHNIPVEQFMTWLFYSAASMYEAGNMGLVRVEASKHGFDTCNRT